MARKGKSSSANAKAIPMKGRSLKGTLGEKKLSKSSASAPFAPMLSRKA
jgi:hypothetical protein